MILTLSRPFVPLFFSKTSTTIFGQLNIGRHKLLSQHSRISYLSNPFTIQFTTMSTTKLMKAVHITRTGGPEVLEYSEIPRPGITGHEDVLIKNLAIGINYIDT